MHGAGWMEGGLHAELREDDPRRRAARDGRGVPGPGRRRRGHAGASSDGGGRPGRPLLRRRAHPGALQDRVPQADAQRLAQLRDVGGGRLAGAAGKANRIWKELLAAYEPPPMDPAVARGARGVRRPPRRRGRRPDRLSGSTVARPSVREGPCEDRSAQVVVIGGGVVGASVLYHLTKAGLDRRHAARAARADGRLDLARRRRDAHAQRRPERGPAAAVHDPAVRGDRAGLRAGLLHPPARRADAGRHRGPDGLAADGPGARPLSRDGPGAHLGRARRRTCSRCWTRSTSSGRCTTRSRATSTRPASPGPT